MCVCAREKRPERDRKMKRQRKRQEGEVITRPTERFKESERGLERGRGEMESAEERRKEVT